MQGIWDHKRCRRELECKSTAVSIEGQASVQALSGGASLAAGPCSQVVRGGRFPIDRPRRLQQRRVPTTRQSCCAASGFSNQSSAPLISLLVSQGQDSARDCPRMQSSMRDQLIRQLRAELGRPRPSLPFISAHVASVRSASTSSNKRPCPSCRAPSRAAAHRRSLATSSSSSPPGSAPEKSQTGKPQRESGENAVLQELGERGLLQDMTSRAVSSHLNSAPRTLYLGVDPSAASLHIGNLIPLLALVHFVLAGHNALLLVSRLPQDSHSELEADSIAHLTGRRRNRVDR